MYKYGDINNSERKLIFFFRADLMPEENIKGTENLYMSSVTVGKFDRC